VGSIQDSDTTIVRHAPSPTLLGWLAEHGLKREHVEDWCLLRGETVIYPRNHVDGTTGLKYHNVSTGKRWAEPPGWKAAETVPLIISGIDSLDRLYITEGESDALCLNQYYHTNTLACPGAGIFPNEWAKYVYPYKEVYLIPDNDDAGKKMMNTVANVLPRVRIVRLPSQYKDVCEWLTDPDRSSSLEQLSEGARHHTPTTTIRLTRPYEGSIDHSHKILTVAGRYTTLHRHGGEWRGLCPLHDEDSPSFFVNDKKGLWFCHGCSKGGDSIKLVMLSEGLCFREAIKKVEKM